jgi:hypothetical protein
MLERRACIGLQPNGGGWLCFVGDHINTNEKGTFNPPIQPLAFSFDYHHIFCIPTYDSCQESSLKAVIKGSLAWLRELLWTKCNACLP